MKERKVCPICVAGANNFVNYCIGEDCAWWVKWAEECSVPLIAGMFADSSICRNAFPTPSELPKEEE